MPLDAALENVLAPVVIEIGQQHAGVRHRRMNVAIDRREAEIVLGWFIQIADVVMVLILVSGEYSGPGPSRPRGGSLPLVPAKAGPC